MNENHLTTDYVTPLIRCLSFDPDSILAASSTDNLNAGSYNDWNETDINW